MVLSCRDEGSAPLLCGKARPFREGICSFCSEATPPSSLWDGHSHSLPLFSESFFVQRVNYIHQNPVRAGLVERAEDYLWSSIRCWKRWPRDDEPLLPDLDKIAWRKPR